METRGRERPRCWRGLAHAVAKPSGSREADGAASRRATRREAASLPQGRHPADDGTSGGNARSGGGVFWRGSRGVAARALEAVEDLADSTRLLDESENAHLAAALAAGQRVDLVDAAEQLRPQPATAAAFGGAGLVLGRIGRPGPPRPRRNGAP